jgi:hypothetical protein
MVVVELITRMDSYPYGVVDMVVAEPQQQLP